MRGVLTEADRLTASGQFSQAIRTLRTIRASGVDSVRTQAALAEALQLNGRGEEALALARSTLSSKHRTSDAEARCMMVLALVAFEKGQVGESLKAFQRAQQLARTAGDSHLSCRIQLELIANLADLRGASSVRAMLADCQRALAALGHPHLEARLHITIAQIEGKRGFLHQAVSHLNRAEVLLSANSNVWLDGLLFLNRSTVIALEGRVEDALVAAEQALRFAEESGHLRTKLGAIGNIAYLSLWTSNIERTKDYCSKGLSMAQGLADIRLAMLDTKAQAMLVSGQISECRRLLDEIEALSTKDDGFFPSWYAVATAHTHARLRSLEQDWDSAASACTAATLLADRRRDRLHQVTLRVLGSDALLELGRTGEAADLIADAVNLADSVPVAVFAEVERARAALVAKTVGRDAAERQFTRALRILAAAGGIAPRLDATLSYARTMRTSDEGIRRELKARAWSLEPFVRTSMPGNGHLPYAHPSARVLAQNPSVADIVALSHLIPRPRLLAQETFVLLRESGCVRALAILARSGNDDTLTGEIVAREGWSSEEAARAAGSDTVNRIPMGLDGERELDLVILPDEDIRSRALVRDVRSLLTQFRRLASYEAEERARSSLMSPDIGEEPKDGIFVSDRMQSLVATAKQVAATDLPILITGETGTGKEVLARLIHRHSDRATKDLVPYNCTAVPKEMVDSQLFGHRKGSFTGAVEHALGVIRSADGGTLLLDEIGEIGLDIQPKLLRFLENREVHPIGENRPVPVDVRVIAATNANLDDLVRAGQFREDLLYRLNIVTLAIPPLRERREEIPQLVRYFLRRYATDRGRSKVTMSDDAEKCLLLYEWPGNVRRLANEIRRAVTLSGESDVIDLKHLSPEIVEAVQLTPTQHPAAATMHEIRVATNQTLRDATEQLERTMIQRALDSSNGQVGVAAAALGISRKGLFLKRQRLGLTGQS